jgi:hypothetical protein
MLVLDSTTVYIPLITVSGLMALLNIFMALWRREKSLVLYALAFAMACGSFVAASRPEPEILKTLGLELILISGFYLFMTWGIREDAEPA